MTDGANDRTKGVLRDDELTAVELFERIIEEAKDPLDFEAMVKAFDRRRSEEQRQEIVRDGFRKMYVEEIAKRRH